MFKQLDKLVIFICASGLNFNPAMSLASELRVPSHTSTNNLVSQTANINNNLIIQPIHLEISLRNRRVTLYRGQNRIKSYPIAVGRQDWETPIGNFRVRTMLENPTWINPFTGKAIPGGDPENPLGKYWIGFWTNGKNWVGFHGTPNPDSVGKAASHGCIRMYNNDVRELFYQVNMGTPVTVVR
ncbi:L,D-transpeptidase [Nostoc sp. DedSLP04]|uniref:L,D-transpeptidase n=1 Tax=Nostoc sp. DedSLP04 TaxID=3075401 RepID=UPI002AD261F6|nr:L,D-transpeptidase [Nostoc sp. DedSLP04]MDZ8032934.1 L,D-transpeptidase [Nostoc sp. DedSLP04]